VLNLGGHDSIAEITPYIELGQAAFLGKTCRNARTRRREPYHLHLAALLTQPAAAGSRHP
jgi:hypothetical protein